MKSQNHHAIKMQLDSCTRERHGRISRSIQKWYTEWPSRHFGWLAFEHRCVAVHLSLRCQLGQVLSEPLSFLRLRTRQCLGCFLASWLWAWRAVIFVDPIHRLIGTRVHLNAGPQPLHKAQAACHHQHQTTYIYIYLMWQLQITF